VNAERLVAERAAAEAYSELCAKVVHAFNNDLRTPLTVLLCRTELLLETGTFPESARSSLEAMRRAGAAIRDRLVYLAADVDEHDAARAGRAQVHLASFLGDVVKEVDPAAARVELALASGTEDLSVDVYASLLRRAVAGLLHNALGHSPEGSPVGLWVRVETGHLCIEVRDHGPGISERGRVRAAAWPASDDPSRLRGGGLAVANLVATAHCGRLDLTNRPEGGLSATLRLDLRAISGA
jgi:two-component system sensor histidine kinase TctE